jgi:hypothetical protein
MQTLSQGHNISLLVIYIQFCLHSNCANPWYRKLTKYLLIEEFQLLGHNSAELYFLPASRGIVIWFIFRSWRWRRNVPPKRRLIFNGLHGVISRTTELFTTIAMRTSDPIRTWYEVYLLVIQPGQGRKLFKSEVLTDVLTKSSVVAV